MFDEYRFRTAVRKAGLTMTAVARFMGLDKVTLYRKLSGKSEFKRSEIQICKELLNLKDIDSVFFADKEEN